MPGSVSESVKRKARELLSRRGMTIGPEYGPDLSPQTVKTIQMVRPHTMTTVERIEAVCSATEYVVAHDIPGAFVESGVWMGGSSMAAAATLVNLGITDRELYLFDTFEGIPAPGEHDAMIGSDVSLQQWWDKENNKEAAPWLQAPVDQVLKNMLSTGYPRDGVHLVPGLVEDTLPASAPDQIALLRLDTDWYESTRLEMQLLFPRLSPGGVLIVDDYGFTTGARKAVDEFLATYEHPVFLHRIDSCGRLAIKPGVAT